MHAFLSFLTAPLSLLWGAVAVIRGKCFDWGLLQSKHYPIPVICVGNLAVGGTGKTPHVEYLLKLLHAEGYRVAMLSRGYGRKTKGYVLATQSHTAADIGDEPYQMSRNCPFAQIAVCEKRVVGMRHLLEQEVPPQVVVLDDAFQHRYVTAGLNILLTDAHRLYTRDHLLPWGRLREPASAARRAQAVVVTKCHEGEKPELEVLPHQHLFYSQLCYGAPYAISGQHTLQPGSWKGKRLLLIAGIANPEPLKRYLLQEGAKAVQVLAFADHHNFGPTDVARINHTWNELSASTSGMLKDLKRSENEPYTHSDTANEHTAHTSSHLMAVTTQKDAARLEPLLGQLAADLRKSLYVQPITVQLSTASAQHINFNQFILEYVSQNSGNRRMD